jgi:hypothetical protein
LSRRLIVGPGYNARLFQTLFQTLLHSEGTEEEIMSYQKTVSRTEEIRNELKKIETSYQADIVATGQAAGREAQKLIRTMTDKAGVCGKQLKENVADARRHRDQRKQGAKKTLDEAIRAAQGTYDSTMHSIETDFDGRVDAANKVNTEAVAPIEAEFHAADTALADKLTGAYEAKKTAYAAACAPLREELEKLEAEAHAKEEVRLAKLNKQREVETTAEPI